MRLGEVASLLCLTNSWMKIYQVAASFVNPFCSLSFDWRLFRMIISHLFCTQRDFQPDKDQVTRPPPVWIKGSRTVAWRVVTSQWSFQETQIKLEYWRYLPLHDTLWQVNESLKKHSWAQFSKMPRSASWHKNGVCDQRVYYTTTTVSGATLSLISCCCVFSEIIFKNGERGGVCVVTRESIIQQLPPPVQLFH